MPFIMDRQGQKLNKFTRTNLSYFSRDSEWEDYKELVRRPVAGIISWHDDAISEVFNVTNGNPYFTNILCSAVLRNAIEERDSDVTAREVEDAVASLVSSLDANSFIHLWQDGIFRPTGERDPEILRRGRVLVAVARCCRAGCDLTLTKISEHKGTSLLNDAEILPVLNDFVRREVMSEAGGVYKFKLPLFEMWLVDVGVSSLIADSLSEEVATSIQNEEEEARVTSAEVVAVTKRWPAFRGRHVSTEDVRAWIEQVETHRDQRLLFTILKNVKFYGEAEIRDKLRIAHLALRRRLPEFVIRKKGDRRDDVIITYVDGEGKSGQYYASTYAEENRISVKNIISPAKFKSAVTDFLVVGSRPEALVIVDDVAATGDTLAKYVVEFVEEHLSVIKNLGCEVIVVALVATRSAILKIESVFGKIEDVNVSLRVGETLGPDAYAFEPGNGIWQTEEESDRARALCVDIGARIDRRRPLGYGGLGLLVVFPSTTPNNSLPILYGSSKAGGVGRWRPIFPRISN